MSSKKRSSKATTERKENKSLGNGKAPSLDVVVGSKVKLPLRGFQLPKGVRVHYEDHKTGKVAVATLFDPKTYTITYGVAKFTFDRDNHGNMVERFTPKDRKGICRSSVARLLKRKWTVTPTADMFKTMFERRLPINRQAAFKAQMHIHKIVHKGEYYTTKGSKRVIDESKLPKEMVAKAHKIAEAETRRQCIKRLVGRDRWERRKTASIKARAASASTSSGAPASSARGSSHHSTRASEGKR